MADKRWVSTTGDLNAAASYSPSGVPVDLDSIHCDGSSNFDWLSNLSSFSPTITQTRFWFQAAYQGNAGAEGNPLKASAKYFIHQGSGSIVHHLFSGASNPYVVIDSPNTQDAYTLTDTDGAAGLTITLACLNGGVKLLDNDNIVVGRMIVGDGRSGQSNPIVDIGTVGSVVGYRQNSGYVVTKNPLGANVSTDYAVLDGGTLVYHAQAHATRKWARVEITGGRMEFNGVGVVATVNMDLCIVSSGTLDMTKDSRAKKITTLILMPGSTFLTHQNITVTNLVDLRGSYPILP